MSQATQSLPGRYLSWLRTPTPRSLRRPTSGEGCRPSRPGLTSTGPGEKSRRPTAGQEGRGGHPKGGSLTPSWAGLGRGGDLAKTCGEVSRPSTSGIRIRAKGSQRWKESGPEVGSYRVGGERQLGQPGRVRRHPGSSPLPPSPPPPLRISSPAPPTGYRTPTPKDHPP